MVSQVKNLEKKSKVDGQIKQINLFKKEECIQNKTKKIPKTNKGNQFSYE